MIPNVKNIQDKKIHNLICFAQRLFTFLQTSAESDEEKIIEEPTYPKYKIGGWIASAGSCKIGFKPKPSFGIGKIWLNGLEVFIKKIKNPIIIISWKIKVNNLSLIGLLFELKK